jgi:methionyl aminopeptidase
MDKVKIMAIGGAKLKEIKKTLIQTTKVGMKLSQIEAEAQKLIKEAGGQASFAMVPGYSWATCINLNSGLVHGIPDDKVIKDGDVVSIDVGIYFKGYHTDTSFTFIIGKPDDYQEKKKFLETGEKALNLAIKQAKVGKHIGHISRAMQETVEKEGYNVARNLTGHGISTTLHHQPMIPCYLEEDVKSTPVIEEGLTIAIEIIYMQGSSDTITDKKDGWTIATKDGKLAGMFEHTVAVTKNGPVILT